MSDDKDPNEATAEDGDLLGGLESLLDKEGSGLDLPDDDLGEDELTDLFADDDDEAPAAVATPTRERSRQRDARSERRQRDQDEYRNLEAHLRATPLGLEVSEDKMTAQVSRLTADNSYEEILGLLKREKIKNGIDHEVIRTALSKAATGQNQYEVIVARGLRAKVVSPSKIVHHLPKELITEKDAQKTDFERLKRLMDGEFLEAIKNWKGVSKLVSKGTIVAELVPAETEPGCDVFGEQVELEAFDSLAIEVGDNVTLSEDERTATADLYGYVGLLAGQPTVVPPIWMSNDHMEARFIFHPSAPPLAIPTEEELLELLELKWIEYGVMERQVELICKRLETKQSLPVSVPLAQGSPEIHGEDAQVKYAFDPYELMKWRKRSWSVRARRNRLVRPG